MVAGVGRGGERESEGGKEGEEGRVVAKSSFCSGRRRKRERVKVCGDSEEGDRLRIKGRRR